VSLNALCEAVVGRYHVANDKEDRVVTEICPGKLTFENASKTNLDKGKRDYEEKYATATITPSG
jgi:hypothetical protein